MAYPLRSNIPKVNQSNFGPVDYGSGAGLMAQGLKRKRYPGDTENDPGPRGIMKEVSDERAISEKEALKAQKRKNEKEEQAKSLGLLDALFKKGDEFTKKSLDDTVPVSSSQTTITDDQAREEFLRGSKRVDKAFDGESIPYIGYGKGEPPTEEQAAMAYSSSPFDQKAGEFVSSSSVTTINRDDPPEVQEAKTLQAQAAKGDRQAKAEQTKLYSQFKDPQVRAQVKEELGNYYIDPISGTPINLEELRNSPKRQRDMKMIAMFPEHMRPHALANMGYLDKEDIPVDYKHMLKRDQLTFDMSKWSAEHSERNRQFNATLDFKQKTQKDLEKRLGRKLTLEEKTQNDLNADRDYKQLWDNINNLIKEGNSPAATLLAKGAGLKLDFNANTAIQTEILEQMSDAKSAGINHPQGKEGTKAYFKFASDVHQKLITPRGDNISGDTYFDKALKAAGISTYRESGYKGPEHVYNSLHYDKAYAAMMMRSPHAAFHKAVTNQNIAINLGGSTGNTTGSGTSTQTGGNKGGNNGNKTDTSKVNTSGFETQDSVEGSGFMEGESDEELALGAGVSTALEKAMSNKEKNELAQLQGRLKERREKDAAYKEEQGSVTSPYAVLNFLDELYTKYALQPPSKRQLARSKR